MTDGIIHIWDPHRLLSKQQDHNNALLASLSLNAGSVTAMSTSSLEPNQLKVGSSKGHIAIVDLTDPTSPWPLPPATTTTARANLLTALPPWLGTLKSSTLLPRPRFSRHCYNLALEEISQNMVSHACRTSRTSRVMINLHWNIPCRDCTC